MLVIDSDTHMKCGLIIENKTFIELVFFKFLLDSKPVLFTLALAICRYGLNQLHLAKFHYQALSQDAPKCWSRNMCLLRLILLVDVLGRD